jgi:hypothetical protein
MPMSYVIEIPEKRIISHSNDLIYKESGPCFSRDLDEFISDNDIVIKKIYYIRLGIHLKNNIIKTEEDIKKYCFSIKRNIYNQKYENIAITKWGTYVSHYRWFILLNLHREYIALKMFL